MATDMRLVQGEITEDKDVARLRMLLTGLLQSLLAEGTESPVLGCMEDSRPINLKDWRKP